MGAGGHGEGGGYLHDLQCPGGREYEHAGGDPCFGWVEMGWDWLGGSVWVLMDWDGCSGVCILLEWLDQEDCQTPECPHSGGRAGVVIQQLDILLVIL